MDIATVRQKFPQYKDLSDEQLAGALHKKYYADMPYQQFAGQIGLTTPKRQSAVDVAVNMLATPMREYPGFKRGVEDVVDAGAQMLVNALPEGLVSAANRAFGSKMAPTAQQFNQQQAQEEKQYQSQRLSGGVDVGRLTGNMAATAPLATVLPGPGATMVGTAVKGAVTGGAIGSMQPVTDDQKGFWDQKGDQAAIGAIAGGVAAPVIQGASRVISPRVDQAVKYLTDRGVTPRPGQMIGPRAAAFEDKAMSAPIVGDAIAGAQRRAVEDFNRAAYNEVLKPLGVKFDGPIGREGFAQVQKQLGSAYDDVLPKIQFKPDRQFIDEFKNLSEMAKSLPEERFAQFKTVMERDLVGRLNKGSMDGQSFKVVEEKLGDFARPYMASGDADQRALGAAVNEVLKSARTSLERANPTYAGQLRRINQAYAAFTRVRGAVSRIGAAEGVFTPDQLLSSSLRLDKSAGKGSFAKGDALMQRLAENAKKVIGIKYPDSGTAGRLANMGAGAALVMNPALTLGGGMAASLPYTQTGQSLARTLLTERPALAGPIGSALNRSAVPGGGILGPLGAGLLFAPDEESQGNNKYRR